MACTSDIKIKNDRENRKRGYEVQIEESYPVENFQRKIGHIQSNDQIHSQVIVVEFPQKAQEEYLQLYFISYLQRDRIPVFEAYLRRSNLVVKMSEDLPYLNLPIWEGPKSSYMSGLANTGAVLNVRNIE